MGTEQQGNVPIGERERERESERDGEDDKRSCENFEFCRESLAAAIAHFFFFVFFLVFLLLMVFIWFACCLLHSLCVCVCFFWERTVL
jgi:hypothetical protein